jgi:hypothetical protein
MYLKTFLEKDKLLLKGFVLSYIAVSTEDDSPKAVNIGNGKVYTLNQDRSEFVLSYEMQQFAGNPPFEFTPLFSEIELGGVVQDIVFSFV